MVSAWSADKCLFRTLGSADGLSSNSVACLLADSRGYLWIGTDQGLNRYDGHEVKTHFAEESNPSLHDIFHTRIHSLQEDAEGHLWIEGEQGKYYIYDTRTLKYV
jgi:ligand-binding sensor domain-containing protein